MWYKLWVLLPTKKNNTSWNQIIKLSWWLKQIAFTNIELKFLWKEITSLVISKYVESMNLKLILSKYSLITYQKLTTWSNSLEKS